MWVLATRSRPDNCRRFIQAWSDTKASTSVLLRFDQCDPALEQLINLDWPQNFQIRIGSRIGLSGSINELFELYPNESWYGMLADDLLPRTMTWDLSLIESCGNWSISYANDLGARDWPTHPCVGGDLVRAIGWFGLPVCHHYFTDTVWKYLGENLNIIHRLDNVVVEHLHYSLGKSAMDQVYQQSNDHYASDKRAFAHWCRQQGPAVIEKLRNMLA